MGQRVQEAASLGTASPLANTRSGMSGATHYERLGVDQAASPEEIKRAYRRRARLLHPDANSGNPRASRQFGEATDAYRTLSDPELRASYDAALNGGSEQPGEATASQDDAADEARTNGTNPDSADDRGTPTVDDIGDEGWGESDPLWEDYQSFGPKGYEASNSRRRDDSPPNDWRAGDRARDDSWTDTSSASDRFEDRSRDRFDRSDGLGDRGRPAAEWDMQPGSGYGWGEPDPPPAAPRPKPGPRPRPVDDVGTPPSYRAGLSGTDPPPVTSRPPAFGDDPWDELEYGTPDPAIRPGRPEDPFDAAVGNFSMSPDDVILGRADRATQLVCVAPVVWVAGMAMDSSLAQVVRDLLAYRRASADDDATGWERATASGDLAVATGRFALVLAVAALAWFAAGRTLRMQSVTIAQRERWWRSPGWDGTARLIRAGAFVAIAWLTTALLLVPSLADQARAHAAAEEVTESADDRVGQLEDAFRSAEDSAASGRWRLALWLVVLPTAWVGSAKLPARFGYYSRLDLI